MNKSRLITVGALATFLVAAPLAPALDFTLSTRIVEQDGFPREISYFAYDARTTVAIQVPSRWKILTTAATLTLVAESMPGSEVDVEKSPFAPSAQFKEPDLTRYREHALAQAPAGSTDVRVIAEKENPLPIFDWTGREYVLEYAFYGQNYKRSVFFLNVDAVTQLRVTAMGPPANFDRVHKAAYAFLQSWQPKTSPPPAR